MPWTPKAPPVPTVRPAADTGVRKTDAADGMAALVITATDPDAEWAYTVLDTLARAKLHALTRTASWERDQQRGSRFDDGTYQR